jgi:hypothetical protein
VAIQVLFAKAGARNFLDLLLHGFAGCFERLPILDNALAQHQKPVPPKEAPHLVSRRQSGLQPLKQKFAPHLSNAE